MSGVRVELEMGSPHTADTIPMAVWYGVHGFGYGVQKANPWYTCDEP